MYERARGFPRNPSRMFYIRTFLTIDHAQAAFLSGVAEPSYGYSVRTQVLRATISGIRAEGGRPEVCQFRVTVGLAYAVSVHVGAPSGGQDGSTVVPM